MARNLKSWEEASSSPEYQNATPEQQEDMKQQYIEAGGNIPTESTQEQSLPEEKGFFRSIADIPREGYQFGKDLLSAAYDTADRAVGKGIGGAISMIEDTLDTGTTYGKRFNEENRKYREKELSKIQNGLAKDIGMATGKIGMDIALTLANPLIAAGLIAAREGGEAYADQEEGNKNALTALGVGGANYLAQKMLPGTNLTASSKVGRIGQGIVQGGIAGAKGGAVVGASEGVNKYRDDLTPEDVLASTLEGGVSGAAFGGTVGGLHSGLFGKNQSKVFKETPEAAKGEIEHQASNLRKANTPEEIRDTLKYSDTYNTANALDVLDKNGFRINNSVASDYPSAQKILNTTQDKAVKSATGLKDKSNVEGFGESLSGKRSKERGKSYADEEYNQKQAVSMIDSNKQNSEYNNNLLNNVIKDVTRRRDIAERSGEYSADTADLRLVLDNDKKFYQAYKDFNDDLSSFKYRTGDSFSNLENKAYELQKLESNISPEMREALGGIRKIKGLSEGFSPIQDAHVLNNVARLMENQDRGWKTVTSSGYKSKESPIIIKPIPFVKHTVDKFRAGKAREELREQQDTNKAAIQDLASLDYNINKSRAQTQAARETMKNPPEQEIPFTYSESSPANIEPEIRSRMAPDPLQTPLESYRNRPSTEVEPISEPEIPKSISSQELSNIPKKLQRAEKVEKKEEPVVEPTPEEKETKPSISSKDLAETEARIKSTSKKKEQETKVEEPPKEEIKEESKPKIKSDELIREREKADKLRKEYEDRKSKEQEVKEEPKQEPEVKKSEPLPTEIPQSKKSEEIKPIKPKEGIELLSSKTSHEKAGMKMKADRLRNSLFTDEAKALVTPENFLSKGGRWKDFEREIIALDNSKNIDRYRTIARQQEERSQIMRKEVSNKIREQFSDWVKDRGLPEEFAKKALRLEEKGKDGNVSSLDLLMKRAENLYRKDKQKKYDNLFEEALKEDAKRFPKEISPLISDQKSDFSSELDNLLSKENFTPSQKKAIKSNMSDYIDRITKPYEKAGRQEGFAPGKLAEEYERFYNEYSRQSDVFIKANRDSKLKLDDDMKTKRSEKLKEAIQKRKESLETRRKRDFDEIATKAFDSQRSEIDKFLNKLPDSIKNEVDITDKMNYFGSKGYPVPKEQMRYLINNLKEKELSSLEKSGKDSINNIESVNDKYENVLSKLDDINNKFDINKKSKISVIEESDLKKTNDLFDVQKQRDDIRNRVLNSLEERNIPREDAKLFADSYIDKKYSLLEEPMSNVKYQNARARIDDDVEKFAKQHDKKTKLELQVDSLSEGSLSDSNIQDKDLLKILDDARKSNEELNKLFKLEEDIRDKRSTLPDRERERIESYQKENISSNEDQLLKAAESAFSSGKSLDELYTLASILDKVGGRDRVGNNRRFITALRKASENKKKYGDNPISWFSYENYSDISKLGSSSAGGNKERALIKIFGTTPEEAKSKLLGPSDFTKMKKVIENNPDTRIPSFKTTSRRDYLSFLEKFNEDGTKKKGGSLRDLSELNKKRVRPKKLRLNR